MRRIQDTYRGAALKCGSAILMARLVVGAGRPIERTDVDAIEYSIYEIDLGRQVDRRVLAGHDCVALDVPGVLFNSLQKCRLWTLDDVGYNFCHELYVGQDRHVTRAGVHYQVQYKLTPTIGQTTIVRFQLRMP